MSSEKTVINMNLLLWCFVVIIELCILAYLIHGLEVLLFGLILFSPITAAFSWPATEEIEDKNKKTLEEKTEKAE